MGEIDKRKIGVGFGVLILRDSKVLLGRRNIDPLKASSLLNGAGTWTMPGGKLEFGESFEEGAKREVLEETGLVVDDLEVICVSNDIVDTAHFVTLGLMAHSVQGEPQALEPDTISPWVWYDLDKLPSPMYFPSERILKNYLQKRFYTFFGKV